MIFYILYLDSFLSPHEQLRDDILDMILPFYLILIMLS
jgi:hypothetical protein